ncbi:hypothetical protein T265_01907 [Opisthorchis viverrini]|uniref:GIY-YIG domain-containing protein n=1 Tax=Opisthorchis viverrini TaxID=6198 RepID=A0A074ZY08_OPIVI|nr:hypothetical protein T265_01907 [Opisthorchis viverrini]KER31976.1 hypothetical protein T265_01907 [Opisthorchis viverrini]
MLTNEDVEENIRIDGFMRHIGSNDTLYRIQHIHHLMQYLNRTRKVEQTRRALESHQPRASFYAYSLRIFKKDKSSMYHIHSESERRVLKPFNSMMRNKGASVLGFHYLLPALVSTGWEINGLPKRASMKLISRPKDNRDKTKRNNVIYQIDCNDCNKFYVGQTGRKLRTRIKEHNAAVKRHDPLSLISIHEDQEGHKFNMENAKILAYGDTRHGREFLEAWYSTTGSINRCIELDPIYAPLRARDQRRNRNTQGGPNNGFTNEETRNSSESNQ